MRRMMQFNGVYDTMDFPPYKYQEYPKWVTAPDGSRLIVETAREELEVAQRSGAAAGAASTPDTTASELAKAFERVRELEAQLEAAKLAAKPAEELAPSSEAGPAAKLILTQAPKPKVP